MSTTIDPADIARVTAVPPDGAGIPDSPVELLRRWVTADPHAPAVVSDAGTLSRRQLWDSAGCVASHLRLFGADRDTCVGLYLEASVELVQAAWGVLGSGAGYLPLSPDYPDERIAFMVDDSGTRVVLTTARLAKKFRSLAPPGVEVLAMEYLLEMTPADPAAGLLETKGDRLAYTIYTSGSTGRPKGVLIEQHSIAHQMDWISRSDLLPAGSRILQKTPASFDASQWEILASACGAAVVIPPPQGFRDPEAISAAVRRHRVTALQCVPTMWRALADAELIADCTSLTHLFSGGELLTTALAGALRRARPAARLVNLYGPTEATINCAWQDVTDEVLRQAGTAVPVGYAVPGVELFVLDDRLCVAADDSVGELYVGGSQLARGYLRNDELTAERFIDWSGADGSRRLYRSGDLVRRDRQGALLFVGRRDHQVKVNGYRIELDEVRLAIAEHHWVREACVVPWTNPRTGAAQLAAFVELDPDEAALMDQDQAADHHQSKHSRVQVRAQLTHAGVPTAEELGDRPELPLPGAEPTGDQVAAAFRRKTYRYYEGTALDRERLAELLTGSLAAVRPAAAAPPMTLDVLGRLLRRFGPFHSSERLLPKYSYASPGALNATRIHLEINGLDGVEPGRHYFHPLRHSLVRLDGDGDIARGIRLHLVGRRSAIRAVYLTNVDEVLHFEAGHMLGVLDHVLPALGLSYRPVDPAGPGGIRPAGLSADDIPLAAVDLVAGPQARAIDAPRVRMFVQAHRDRVAGLPTGLYEFVDGAFVPAGAETIRRRDVVAINQEVYERSSFGVSLVCPRERGWAAFVELGRTLQRLQTNDRLVGLMSSGYSSLTGRDLPTARRLEALLDRTDGLSYFALGGPVSPEQQTNRDMSEDKVHMRGPAEILKDELRRLLPQYMLPARIDIVDALPKTTSGKLDVAALTELARAKELERTVVAPRTAEEIAVTELWSSVLDVAEVSVDDDFFASGGNSLLAVGLINRVNKHFGSRLPVQAIFETPTPAALAAAVSAGHHRSPRLIPLTRGAGTPVYCWPGLGGFPMNLLPLGAAVGLDRPFVGVQAHGINTDEVPYSTIQQMAASDVEQMLGAGGREPFTLLGYSFGARVAFEAAYQLEAAGQRVDRLLLVAPGSPRTRLSPGRTGAGAPTGFDNPYFLQILLSVFTGTVSDDRTFAMCRREVRDLDGFCAFVAGIRPELTGELVRRITRIVMLTFDFRYTFEELDSRRVTAPISLIKAAGDDYSFIESRDSYFLHPPVLTSLDHDHYSILHGPGLQALAAVVRDALSPERSELMPHINIKHYPLDLDDEARRLLTEELTRTVARAFQCQPSVISIALEPVAEQEWAARVYRPEIVGRSELLCKSPEYTMPLTSH